MKLHEFQSKSLLAKYGIASPDGLVAVGAEEARANAVELGAERFAVKAQIPAGGRKAAGGVKIVDGADGVEEAARSLIGKRLVTDQTGPAGYEVRQVLVEAAVEAAQNLYIAAMIDTSAAEIVILGAAEGADDIEKRFREGLTAVERLPVSAGGEVEGAAAHKFAASLNVSDGIRNGFVELLGKLAKTLVGLDASLVEINPLVVTSGGELIALDAKIVVDDNALFRHPELAELERVDQPDDLEMSAQLRRLNYVRMDGDIGLVVNGAGLGLATLDMVEAANGRPANFMDIRTTANSLDVAHGFELLLKNPSVKVILINVHGGGMQACDTIGDGLGIAMRRAGRQCPVVVRFAGNNADFARMRLANFGLKIIDCPDMWTAATKAVAAAA